MNYSSVPPNKRICVTTHGYSEEAINFIIDFFHNGDDPNKNEKCIFQNVKLQVGTYISTQLLLGPYLSVKFLRELADKMEQAENELLTELRNKT